MAGGCVDAVAACCRPAILSETLPRLTVDSGVAAGGGGSFELDDPLPCIAAIRSATLVLRTGVSVAGLSAGLFSAAGTGFELDGVVVSLPEEEGVCGCFIAAILSAMLDLCGVVVGAGAGAEEFSPEDFFSIAIRSLTDIPSVDMISLPDPFKKRGKSKLCHHFEENRRAGNSKAGFSATTTKSEKQDALLEVRCSLPIH